MQFAIDPDSGDVVVIEMNPRVSRSSALASKATGFPIAKIAALVAVGFTLDEIPNDITRQTPASFEPSLDYIVVKIPRWDFRKFAGADPVLGPQMKAVGEVMAIGRTFPEALQKAVRALDIGMDGFGADIKARHDPDALRVPTAQRLFQVAAAIADGVSLGQIVADTRFDPWFVQQMRELMSARDTIADKARRPDDIDADEMRRLKQFGFSDLSLARLLSSDEQTVREHRQALGVTASFYRVDTCAAEFQAHTPYLYSTYEMDDEAAPSPARKVMILGRRTEPHRAGHRV